MNRAYLNRIFFTAAVTLNEHLTKALRMLRKGSESDNVDKYACLFLISILSPNPS